MADKNFDAAAAASLSQRLATMSDPDEIATSVTDEDRRRVSRWRSAAARGDDRVFRDRLSDWTSQEPAVFVARLSRHRCDESSPPWGAPLTGLAAPQSVPMGHGHLAALTQPLVERAWQLLAPGEQPLSVAAAGDAREHLAERLATLMQTTVDTRYRAAQAEGSTWQEFERRLLDSGLGVLWSDRPVLARLVGQTVLNWVEATNDLLAQFDADHAALADLLGVCEVTGIESLSPGLSDPHGGGRTVTVVTVLTDEGPRRVVHKPKSVAAEALLAQVLRWVRDRGLDPGPVLAVIDRFDHGWVEFVASAPTDDPHTYFRRCGVLAAVLFALGGNDCHAENLIARGNQPVIIDAETVLQPQIRSESGSAADDDVLDLLLLPRWLRVGGRALDLSALGAAGSGALWQRRTLQWQNGGTDDARLVATTTSPDLVATAARAPDGAVYRPEDFADDLIVGFESAWDTLSQHGPDLLAGPLRELPEVPVRLLARMTRTYTRIADTSLHPDLLRNGLDRSIHLEHLARYVMDRDDWRTTLPLIDAERDQMEDGDIPLFTVMGAATGVVEAGTEVLSFTESAMARAQRRIMTMGPHQLAEQGDLIRTSLALAPPKVRSDLLATYPPDSDQPGPQDRGRTAEAATRILTSLMTQTNRIPKGLVAASRDQWGVEVMTTGWYDGLSGVMVALAAAASALDDDAAGQRARDLLSLDLAEADARGSRLWRGRGIGGQDGVGGILLGWSLAVQLMPDTRTSVSDVTTRLLAQAHLPTANSADLLSGCLGLLAGLSGMQTAGIPVPESLAEDVAAVSLSAADDYFEGPQVNGFSHGNSGIACMLAQAGRLGWAAPDEVTPRVHRALSEESGRYDPDLGDWRDLRVPGRLKSGPGWCNGAPGMVVARLLAGDPADDLDVLMQGMSHDVEPRDNLCCGASGRVEVLRLVRDHGDPTHPATAMHDAAVNALVQRILTDRVRLGVPPGTRLQPLGLFQGISGPLLALAGALDRTTPHALEWGARAAGSAAPEKAGPGSYDPGPSQLG